jgi:hypothetical protein
MLYTFTHPVIANARIFRSQKTKLAIGTIETDIDVAEYSASAVEPAFEIDDKSKIVSIEDRLWRRSSLNVRHLSNSFSVLSNIADNGIAMIDDDYHSDLKDFVSSDLVRQAIPSIPPSLRRHASYNDAMKYLAEAGSIKERKLAFLDEEDVETWRTKMRDYIANFALVDGVTYERCHEPVMVVDAGRIMLSNFAIYSPHVNRSHRTPEGWVLYDDRGLRSDVHVFPADADSEAMDFSQMVNRGEASATWFSIKCHGKCISTPVVLEEETCRFAMMYVRYFSAVRERFARRHGELGLARALESGRTELSAYAKAVTKAAEAVARHRFEVPCFDEVSQSFDELISVSTESDKMLTTEGDRFVWEKLVANTSHLMTRTDALPISFEVSRNHNPKHL